jgi:phosphoribosylformylglycinamidine synthase subunit PurS
MGEPVARVLVDVMLKPEILDPQGQAVQRALPRMGFDSVTNVRQGKRFVLDLADADPASLRATAEQMAEKLLANTVIEDFQVTVLSDGSADSAENA